MFRVLIKVVGKIYGKQKVNFDEKVNGSPSIFVCNHNRMHGPISMVLAHKRQSRIWVIDEMRSLKTAPAYIRRDFWEAKNFLSKGVVRILSYILAPILVYVIKKAGTIGVHYDINIAKTFKESIKELEEGRDIIIFADHSQHHSKLDEHFSIGFVRLGRLFYNKTGHCINFYPVFACREKNTVRYGKAKKYDPKMNLGKQREEIGKYICDEIMQMAAEA